MSSHQTVSFGFQNPTNAFGNIVQGSLLQLQRLPYKPPDGLERQDFRFVRSAHSRASVLQGTELVLATSCEILRYAAQPISGAPEMRCWKH
jgi:hypothetical protein